MTNITSKINSHTVEILNGSGVLIQSMSEDHSYILTAKHLLVADDEGNLLLPGQVAVTTYDNISIPVSKVIPEPDHDLAILVVKNSVPVTLTKCADVVNRDESVLIAGYPLSRRKSEEKLREYQGKIIRTAASNFVVKIDTMPGQEQLDGVSGGGIFRIIGDDVYLCGIQSEMDGNPDLEHHGQVKCIPLNLAEELLKANQLEPTLPIFLKCFSHSITHSFAFERVGTPASVDFLRNTLHQIASTLGQNAEFPNPTEVFERFKEILLINNTPKEDAFNIQMWVAFLEFLVLSSIVDEVDVVDFQYLDKSSKKRRFLFSATKGNWLAHLKDIFTSDFRGLGKDGVIIVSTGEYKGNPKITPITLKDVLTDISRKYSNCLKIDSPVKNPSEFSLYHLSGLHQICVEDKEDEYAVYEIGKDGFDAENLIKKIQGEYREFIGKL